MSNEETEYTVGYGKPPVDHRFKKGRSGNPKGRPRKTKKKSEPPRFKDGHLDNFLEQEAFRTLPLRENGKLVEMSAAQAIMRSIMVDGVKGNRLAKKFAFKMLRKKEREERKFSRDLYIFFTRMKAEGETKLSQYKKQLENNARLPQHQKNTAGRAKPAPHRKQELSPPRLFPHPDDILLDEAKLEVHLLGPQSEDEAIPFERAALVRDWFFALSVFEERFGEVTIFEYGGKSGNVASVVAYLVEDTLPPSFQRDESATVNLLMDLEGLTKRQLRQRMKALMAQIASMPDSMEDRLAHREHAANLGRVLGEGLEKAVAASADDQKLTGRTPDPSPKERAGKRQHGHR